MLKKKTSSDVINIMERIGCFDKAYVDNKNHKEYLNESIEGEDKWHRANRRNVDISKNQDNFFLKIDIHKDYSYLYNASRDKDIKSMLDNGPTAEFAGYSSGSFVWGRGLYTNFQMGQPFGRTITRGDSLYGTVLVKYKYHGDLLNECLVFEKGLSNKIPPISEQLKKFKGLREDLEKNGFSIDSLDDEFLNSTDGAPIENFRNIRDRLGSQGGYGHSLGNYLTQFGVSGVVFFGYSDGPVAVIYRIDKVTIEGYVDNRGKTYNLDDYGNGDDIEPIKWNKIPKGKGVSKEVNTTMPFVEYLKKFGYSADEYTLRAFCGEMLFNHNGNKTFVDVKKVKKMFDENSDKDPRLFGNIEFFDAYPFDPKTNLALVQLDNDKSTQFFIDKKGNLFKSKTDKHPFTTIYDFEAYKNLPQNNAVDDDDDFDINDFDLDDLDESVQNETRTETQDGHVELDNFDVARKIMKFNNSDDAYFVQLVERHKDHPDRHYEHNACDYKTYFEVFSIEHLNAIEPLIKRLCQKGEWRAMLYINARQMNATRDYADNVLAPRFKKHNSHMQGHEVEVAYGQSKSGIDRTGKNWDKERPLCFVDVDNDDKTVHRQVLDYIKKMGITPLDMYNTTNNGLHIILPDNTEARKLDFSFLDKGKQLGRWATAGLEEDKSMTLYAYVQAKGYGVQKRMQQRLGGR